MQQFNVPQFIDVEDKIIGPITTRQFVILLVCSMIAAILYKIVDFVPFLVITIVIFALGGIVAFLKINGRPFHYFVLNLIQTSKKPKVRVWNSQLGKKDKKAKEEKDDSKKKEVKVPRKQVYKKSKLAELSLMVDTGGSYKGGDENIKTSGS